MFIKESESTQLVCIFIRVEGAAAGTKIVFLRLSRAHIPLPPSKDAVHNVYHRSEEERMSSMYLLICRSGPALGVGVKLPCMVSEWPTVTSDQLCGSSLQA